MSMSYHVYMLACMRAGKFHCFYTGYTNDLERRFEEHKRNAATGNKKKFTGRFDSVRLVWSTACPTIEEARHEEKRVKALSSKQKMRLITDAAR